MYMETRGAGNPLIDERIKKQQMKKHKLRVSQARNKGDPITKKTFFSEQNPRLINNAKAIQLDEERVDEIEKQNHKLFTRMQEIELKPVLIGDKRTINPRHLKVGKIEDKRRNFEKIQNENM